MKPGKTIHKTKLSKVIYRGKERYSIDIYVMSDKETVLLFSNKNMPGDHDIHYEYCQTQCGEPCDCGIKKDIASEYYKELERNNHI